MRVDAHHHLWDPALGDYGWLDSEGLEPLRRTFGPQDLAAAAAPVGVDATVLVEAGSSTAESLRMLELARTDPLVQGVVGWVDLLADDVPDQLDRLREAPGGSHLVGVRHQVQGEPDPRWLERPDVQRGLAAVAAAGLCFDLVVRPHQLAAAVAAGQALPDLRLVLDHLGKPDVRGGDLASWQAAAAPLAALPGTTAKLSGLVTEADLETWSADDLLPFVAAALELWGPQRLMVGSDWPVCLLAGDYATVLSATSDCLDRLGVTGDDRAAVDGGTALRTYRWETS